MANDNAKEIRARLKLLVEESGVQKKISAENKRIVQNLRERLKTIRDLNKEEKKMLDKMGDQTDQEKLLLQLGTSKDKQTRNYGKVLDTQLKTNIKMAKGDMGVFKTLRMQFQQRKQIKMINNLDKDIQKAKSIGKLISTNYYKFDYSKDVKGVEICSAIKFLITNKSITGQVIAIDSGQNLNWKTPDIIGNKE